MIEVAMIEVVMSPATTDPAIDVYVGAVNVRAVTNGPVTNGLAVGSTRERHNMGLTVWRHDPHRPCHRVTIRTRDLAHDIVRRRFAGWQSGLRPVPVPPADERVALCPRGTGGQRDTKAHDHCGPSNSSHLRPPSLL